METIAKTPMPVISVLAGVIFLILSLGNLEPLKVLQISLPRISDSQRWPARIMGITLLICGFALTRFESLDSPKAPIQIFVNVPNLPPQADQAIDEFYKLPPNGVTDNGSVPVARFSGQTPNLTSDEKADILEFVSVANLAETYSLTLGDMQYAALVFAGKPLTDISDMINSLNSEGVYYVPLFDTERSYYTDIRLIDDDTIEVDGCEIWSGDYYLISDDSYVTSDASELVPQTITLEYLDVSWYITKINFYDSSAFC